MQLRLGRPLKAKAAAPQRLRRRATAPSTKFGAIAQLGERVLCKHDVVGSIPSGSTILRSRKQSGDATPKLRAKAGK